MVIKREWAGYLKIFTRVYLHRILRRYLNILRSHVFLLTINRLESKVRFFSPVNEKFLRNLRVCIVKQETAALLYCAQGSIPKELISSSLKHSGPVGLLTKCNAQFYILKEEPNSKECRYWESVAEASRTSTLHELRDLKTAIFKAGERGHTFPQGLISMASEEIDFSAFDVVLSYNISVPYKIVSQFPRILWLFCTTEPMPFLRAVRQKLDVFRYYDYHLNQMARGTYFVNKHSIECPLNIQYYGCFNDAYGRELDDSSIRSKIFIESHTYKNLSTNVSTDLRKHGILCTTSPAIEVIIRDLLESKYYIVLRTQGLRGNGVIEAISCGCLVLADFGLLLNSDMLGLACNVTSWEEVIARIAVFNKRIDAYEEAVAFQRRAVNLLCFDRPMQQIAEALWKKSNL